MKSLDSPRHDLTALTAFKSEGQAFTNPRRNHAATLYDLHPPETQRD